MNIATDKIVIYTSADIVRGTSAPNDTSKVWIDTSSTPPILKTYDSINQKWIAPNEAEIAGLTELVESHQTSLDIIDGQISTLISDSYIQQEDGTTVSMKTLYSQMSQTVGSLSTTVGQVQQATTEQGDQIESIQTEVEQTADKISWVVKSGTSESNFELTDRAASLVADYINLHGAVTFEGLDANIQADITEATDTAEDAILIASTASAFAISLSNELCVVQTDVDGGNGAYAGIGTSLSCYYGGQDVTDDVSITYETTNVAGSMSGDTFTVTNLTADTGYVDFTATYSYLDYSGTSKQLTATKRLTVVRNKKAIGISSVVSYFAVSSSPSVAPEAGWDTAMPDREAGEYLWRKDLVTYDDGSSAETAPYVVTGDKGDAGSDSVSVWCGAEGIVLPCDPSGVVSTAIEISVPFAGYVGHNQTACTVQVSNLPNGITISENTAATATDTGLLVLEAASGANLNSTGTIILTFTCQGTTFLRYLSWAKALEGSSGTDGESASSLSLYASTYVVPFDADGNPKIDDNVSLTAVLQNLDGAITWEAKGNGVTPINLTGSGSSRTLSVSYFDIYDYVTVKVTAGAYSDSSTISKIQDGQNGSDGTDGTNGTSVTVSGTSVTYQASTSGTTAPSGNWSISIPTVSAGQYLWTKTVVNYSDGKSTTSYSVSRSGTNGNNGTSVTITSTSVAYQTSNSGTSTPTGSWSSTIPTTSAGQYLWTRTVVTYSDGNSTTSYSVSRNGADGADGQDAVSVILTNESRTFSGSNSAALAGSAITQVIGYVGTTRTAVTIGSISGLPNGMTASIFNNGTINARVTFSVSTSMTTQNGSVTIPCTCGGVTINKVFSYAIAFKGDQGEKGDTGASAINYVVQSSVDTVTKNISSILTPASVTFSFYSRTGSSASQSTYYGRCIIQESSNGTSWTTRYTASSNISSRTYTPSSADITYIKCTLYAAGGTTQALAEKTITVIFDADTMATLLAIENNQTVIDGSKILTGSIMASKINVTDLFAQDITATGTISGVHLVGATGSFSGQITAASGNVAGWGISPDRFSCSKIYNGVEYQYVLQAPSETAQYDDVLYCRHRALGASAWEIDFQLQTSGYINANRLSIHGNAVIDENVTVGGSLSAYNGWAIPRIQHGYTTVNLTANTNTDFTITFPKSFPGTPDVLFNLRHNSDATSIETKLKSASASGFSGFARSSTGGNHVVHWVAVY